MILTKCIDRRNRKTDIFCFLPSLKQGILHFLFLNPTNKVFLFVESLNLDWEGALVLVVKVVDNPLAFLEVDAEEDVGNREHVFPGAEFAGDFFMELLACEGPES